MTNAKEVIEAARNWHKLSLVVSATALILLFAQPKADYRRALNEAYILRDLRMSDYESFVRGFIGQNALLPTSPTVPYGDWPRDISEFLDSQLDFKVEDGSFPNPDWQITTIVEYDRPPTNGTLQDWHAWVNSSKPASYFHPDWKTARLSASRGGVRTPPLVRHFSLRASSWRRFPGEYTFRAFLDFNVTQDDRSQYANDRAKRADWWSALDRLESRELLDPRPRADLNETKFIVEGDVGSQLREVATKSGIKEWLQQSGLWSRLSRSDDAGEIALPGMRAYWSELREKPLQDAIAFMEQKTREIQDVSLLGLSVPGQLCIVAIPLAYLVMFLFLLLDVRFLQRIQTAQGLAGTSAAPWMALYQDSMAKWATIVSVVVAPPGLCVALLVKYLPRVEAYSVVIAVVSAIGAGVIEFAIVRILSKIRRALARSEEAAQQPPPAEPKA